MDIPNDLIKDFSGLGIHGVMALIIFVMVLLVMKVIDLINKGMDLIRDNVIPLATNHFTHVEAAYMQMDKQAQLTNESIRAHTDAIRNNTIMIETQGKLLRELLQRINDDSKSN